MADTVKIAVEASLKNTQQITEQIRDAFNKGLVDIDAKVLDKLISRVSQGLELLNHGLINDARKAAQSLNVDMLKLYNNINIAAGEASNEVSELMQQLNDAQKQLSKLEKDPHEKDRFRRRPKTGEVVYTKEGLSAEQLKAIGQPGKNGLARIEGHSIDFGAKWSVPNAAYAIGDELRTALSKTGSDRDEKYIEALTNALNAIGFQFKNDKVAIDPATAEKLSAAEKAYEDETKRLNQLVAELTAKVKEEAENSGAPTISSEDGSITTAGMQEATMNNQKNINDALVAEAQALKEARQARKQNNDAQEEAAERQAELTHETEKGTVAQQKQTSAVGKAITTFFGYQMVIRQLRRLWREAINTVTELDKQLTTQAMVTGMTREQTWQLVESYQEIAQATGLAQTTIAGVTTEYLRQGETLENALTLTKAAAAAATVAGINASESVRYLTTAIHGFKLEAEDALAVSDKFAALAAEAATNYEDLAIALSKVASQAALAGMSMDYTLALLTTGLDVTQEAPESIGTALKTVIARMREISDYGKTLEDDMDINQVEAGLRAVGIALKDGTGELRSTEEVLDELGKKWATLTANQQAAVAKALAGTRQQSRLVAIMENYNKVIDYQQTAMTSIGATTAQQVTYLEGMEAAINNLQSTYQSLIKSLISSQEAIDLVNALQKVVAWIGSFLRQPAGRWALLSTIVSVLTRSKDLMDRIKATVDQLIAALSNIRKENEAILRQQQTELQNAQNKLALEQAKQKAAGTISSASRPNGWLSNATNTSTATDAISHVADSLFKTLPQFYKIFTKAGRADLKQQWSDTGSTIKSWWQTNSLVGKIRSRQADKATINNAIEQSRKKHSETEDTKEKEKLESKLNVLTNKRLAIEEKIAYIAKEKLIQENENNQKDLQARLDSIQTEKQTQQAELEKLKTAEAEKQAELQKATTEEAKKVAQNKVDEARSAREGAEAELEKTLETEKQVKGEIAKTEENNKQYKAEQLQTEEDVKQGKVNRTGTKTSAVISKISGIISAATTAIAWIQEWVEIGANYGKQLGAEALESSKRIQAEMYQNTKLKSTIASTSATIQKLSDQVVKTTEDLQALDEAQTEFAEALGLSKDEVANMSAQQIDDFAQAKQQELDRKNQKLAEELNETLTKASYNRSGWEIAGNILGKTAIGAGAGAAAGGWGALIGGVVGLIVGAGEEITRFAIAQDAKNKINALLETDEGVEQFKYALKLNYKDITATTAEGGKEMQEALSHTFSMIVDLFDADDLKAILEQYDYNMADFAEHFNELMGRDLSAVKILSDDKSNIKERVEAAQAIENNTRSDQQIHDAFQKLNSRYLTIGRSFTGIASVLDYISTETDWDISGLSGVIDAFGTDTTGFQAAIQNLITWIQTGATETNLLAEGVQNLSNKELEAIQNMITGGRSLQDVADINTRNRSQVQSFRETQANWNNMTESEQQRFINDNAQFFEDNEARRKFLNGEDITAELKAYQQTIQEESRKAYEAQRQSALTALMKAQQDGNQAAIAAAEANLDIIQQRLQSIEHMFDLSLQEVVDKEQEQLSKMKEMYQKQEKDLTDSLNRRKEAYQKYFDSLASQEAAADYAQNRDQLIESISRLSAGTDATSRNKISDLRKQLAQIEKEEAKRQTEEARQKVLENIDTQINNITQSFDELLNNNKALLSRMDESTQLQYLNYLETLGLTDAEKELAIQNARSLFTGRWDQTGQHNFNNVDVAAAPTPQSPTTNQEPQSIMNLSIGNQTEKVTLKQSDMKELIKQMFTWLNANAGTHFIV